MTRSDLIKKGSGVVRNNAAFFNAFKDYLIEDWGQIPDGCFGCKFQTYFNRWAAQVNKGNTKEIKEKTLTEKKTEMKTYILKDKNFKTFFKGEVLSINSSDSQWSEFIAKDEKNKAYFSVLPLEVASEKEKEDGAEFISEKEKKNVKGTKKAPAEAVKEVE
jgi:hypothetical protein